jgi:hypothetical protein
MKIDKPGLYKGIPTDDYFADPCLEPSLSQSVAKILIEQSPLHARQAHPRLAVEVETGEDDETEKYDKARAIGNAAHLIMMGRGKRLAIIDAPDFRSKAAQTDKQAAIQRGEEPILRKHYFNAHAMTLAANLQITSIPGCERAFKDGDGEVVVVSREDGLWLRAMIDWITPDLREVWDLKTSSMSASPYNTGKLMASAGWHTQAAMHERILDAIDPEGAGRRKFFYVCQENESPFALTVNEIGEAALTIGRKQIDYAINVWSDCLKANVWPAYPSRIIVPELPSWASDGWIKREIAEYDEIRSRTSFGPFDPKNLMAG